MVQPFDRLRGSGMDEAGRTRLLVGAVREPPSVGPAGAEPVGVLPLLHRHRGFGIPNSQGIHIGED